jgi:predicted PolB exonuclease-like 3'-5' exonuclease
MDRSYLVLDIETILDPELPISESSVVERLPAPPHHQIVAIGVLWLDQNYSVLRIGVIGEGKGEAAALNDFARFTEERQPHLVTYNGRGFDLPVLASRCLRHGIPFRYYYQVRDVRYRFTPDGHLDLMDFICDFGASRSARLDVVAKLCGMPGKVGVDGKDVGPLVHAGQIDQVRAYCLCDVVQTAGVFLRVQLLRGELTPLAYQEAMAGLIAAARAEPRVAPVVNAWNEARLRLSEQPTESV